MPNNLRREIEKDFNRQKNYNAILSKVEGGSIMKKVKMKYILAPVCTVLIAVVGLIGVNQFKNSHPDILIGKTDGIEDFRTEKESLKVELNINKIKNMAQMQLDADVKKIDGKTEEIVKLSNEFQFIDTIKIPNGLKLTSAYYIYTRGNQEVKEYNVLRDYVFEYEEENKTKDITIAFSKVGKPLRDYYIDGQDKKSVIGDVELVIAQYKEMYIVRFNNQDIYFDIETNGITETELVDLLQSIISGMRNTNNTPVEDKDINVKEPVSEKVGTSYPTYYAGKYVDNKGNNVILLCENTKSNQKAICKFLGITESKTTFKTAKYSYQYLTKLQDKISKAMINKELPFVTTSSVMEDTNRIKVTVNSNHASDIKKLKDLDILGGAIEIVYNENSIAKKDLLLNKE